MTTSPRPWWITGPVLLGLFFGGGLIGDQLAAILAPGSALARMIGFLTLPAAMMLGFVLWLGAALWTILWRRMAGRENRAADRAGHPGADFMIPPGSRAFLVAVLPLAASAGVLIGILSDGGILRSVLGFVAVGAVYGIVCWKAAQHGYLPFPEE